MSAKTRVAGYALRVAGFSFPVNFLKDKRWSSAINAKISLACKCATYSTGGLSDNATKSTKITPLRKPKSECEAQCGAALRSGEL